MPLPEIERAPRLASITGLRWWAAFAVFVFHFRNLAPLPEPLESLAPFGNLGVTFFFVLSGFVLTWSWSPSTPLTTFYWRRFARIYPLHLVTLLAAIPVFYSLNPDPATPWVKPIELGVLVLCVLLLQGWWRDPAVLFSGNPVSWTLTSEAFFYSVHPWLSRVLRRWAVRGSLVAAGVSIAVMFAFGAAPVLSPGSWLAALPLPILRVPEFVLGMCLAWAMRHGWRPRIPVFGSYVLLAGLAVVVFLLPRFERAAPVAGLVSPFALQFAAIGCGLLIVASVVRELAGNAGWSGTRAIVTLGEWSYAFYLIHSTLIYAALGAFGFQGGGLRAAGWFVAMLVASVVAAGVLHLVVERPMERRMRAWDNARRSAPASSTAP